MLKGKNISIKECLNVHVSNFLFLSSFPLCTMYENCNFRASEPVTSPCKTSLNPKVLQTLMGPCSCSASSRKGGGRAATFCGAGARPSRCGQNNPDQESDQTLHSPECGRGQGPHHPHLGQKSQADIHRVPSGKLSAQLHDSASEKRRDSQTRLCKSQNSSGGTWHLIWSLLTHLNLH